MKFRWLIASPQPLLSGQLAMSQKLSPLLAQCLLNRGLSEPAAISTYLKPRLKPLADPFLRPNMSAAVERLLIARQRDEMLVIFGDYDVDGVTSTALLLEVLRTLGWRAGHYLPHRMDEGYGLSPDAVEHCLNKVPANLLVAVDCGSTAARTIAALRHRGLDRLNETERPGLVALKRVAQCPAAVGVYETAFQLAPRLNAAGRLESAEEALQLLLARNEAEALPRAQKLDARNRERQELERAISQQVIGALKAKFNPQTDLVIVEGQSSWHIGVVGIVATRVLQRFYRPTIIVGGDGERWRGSGRSIPGFDLAKAMRQCSDL